MLRVGVIGCGTQGRHHLQAYQAIDGVEIAGICDADPARLAAAGHDFSVAWQYPDYRQLLDASRFDLVSICTMPATHREISVAALHAGVHVLCEKPVALNAVEALEMAQAAERAGRTLTFGFNMRYMPSARFLKRHIVEGRLGRPIYTRAWTKATDIPWWGKHYVKAISGGGALASTAVHILDLTLWLLGHPEPVTVSASMTRLFPRKRAATAPDREAAASYDVEDLLSGHIRFADGTWLTLEAGWAWDRPDYSYSCEIIGDAAAARFDPLRVIAERDGKPVDCTPAGVAGTDWGQSVVAALRQGNEPPVRVSEALLVQRLIDALYQSAAEGREVAVRSLP